MTITGILSWCVFGLVVGALARFVMPGVQNMSWLLTIVLGIIGSFVGGALSSVIFGGGDTLMNPSGWIMSVVGALIALFVYGRVMKK